MHSGVSGIFLLATEPERGNKESTVPAKALKRKEYVCGALHLASYLCNLPVWGHFFLLFLLIRIMPRKTILQKRREAWMATAREKKGGEMDLGGRHESASHTTLLHSIPSTLTPPPLLHLHTIPPSIQHHLTHPQHHLHHFTHLQHHLHHLNH